MPTVSIIIPVYNRAHLVPQAIESVLNQIFNDYELIVVNDGSTDNTEEVVRLFSDPRLKYIHQENRGVAAARNTGLNACKGEFVAFLDDDDLFLPEKLSLQMDILTNRPEVGLVYGVYYVQTNYQTQMRFAGACYPHLELRDVLLGMPFHPSTMIIRRKWLDLVGNFDEELSSISDDWDLVIRLALAGCPMECVQKPVSIVRIQPMSPTRVIHLRDPEGRKALDKAFNDPRLPGELLDFKDMIYAIGLVRSTRALYVGPHPEQGKQLLERALALYPPLANEHIDILTDKLLGHVTGFSLKDPEETLRNITQHLPSDKHISRRLNRSLWGKFYMDLAFQAYQSRQPVKCWNYMLKALVNQPSNLRNRGVISVLLRSVFGDAFVRRLTRSVKGSKPVIRQGELNQEHY